MTRFLHLFFEPSPAFTRGDLAEAFDHAIESTAEHISVGSNGAYIDADAIELPGSGDAKYRFGRFTAAQRARAGSEDAKPAQVLLVLHGGEVSLYQRVHHTARGVLYLRYYTESETEETDVDSRTAIRACLARGRTRWDAARHAFGDDCAYSKWRADMEMERKYTFKGVPDTWRLIRELHLEVCAGEMSGFVPELDRDFQVFDYESRIFEVGGEPQDRGYISFILQADGRTTVKRKWFTANAEIRRESLFPDMEIYEANLSQKAFELAKAPVLELPSFRRKRFDVNFESLETGNVFGIYFDICRIVDQPDMNFAQCEVEYCRSRTLEPLRGVVEEFEQVNRFTHDFLLRKNAAFEQNLYSKLDFVRDSAYRMKG